MLKKYQQFIIKEEMGGGAGMHFKTSCGITSCITFSRNKIIKKTINIIPEDIFSVEGYDDGMSDVMIDDMFVITSKLENIDIDTILNLKINNDSIFDDLCIDEKDYDKVKCVSDIFTYSNITGLHIDFDFDCNYTYNQLRGGGYGRPKFVAGDCVIDKYDDCTDIEIMINKVDIWIDDLDDLVRDFTPIYTATDVFEEFYDEVMYNYYENAKKFNINEEDEEESNIDYESYNDYLSDKYQKNKR